MGRGWGVSVPTNSSFKNPSNQSVNHCQSFIVTRCQIFQLNCSKFNFGWDSAPDYAGEITALLRPLAGSTHSPRSFGPQCLDLWASIILSPSGLDTRPFFRAKLPQPLKILSTTVLTTHACTTCPSFPCNCTDSTPLCTNLFKLAKN